MIKNIVLCKDCKFAEKHIFPDKVEYACLNSVFDEIEKNDFCSMAQRRGKNEAAATVIWVRGKDGNLWAEGEEHDT